MLMFSKILVPLDGSDHSLRALEVALELAKSFGSKVTLIHVAQISFIPLIAPETPFVSSIPIISPSDFVKLREVGEKAAEEILSKGESIARERGVEVNKVRREGHAVQEIVREAREGGYDLIVMGTKGVSGIRELLLGSVAEGVLRHAPCSVLVVRSLE